MKIAILHEMLVKYGWAEKMVEKFIEMFPEADLFTLIYDEKKMWKFFPKEKINSQVFSLWTQRIYNLFKKQRFCLPFMAKSVEQLDFSSYDVVLWSSSWFAHWAITKPETKFVVYYHSPARYLWDWTNEYKRDVWLNKWIKWYIINNLFLKLRQWDYIASNRVDILVANSQNVADRIRKYYRKDSIILYPPIETEKFSSKIKNDYEIIKNIKNNYYIIISALTEFKKVDVAIKWFNEMPETKLLIIWSWNFKSELEKMIKSDNIQITWFKDWEELISIVQNSLWLVFAWEDDFWMVWVEVMAAWKPVFAFKWGWYKESILEWITWEFFENRDWKDFVEKFRIFDENNRKWLYSALNCKKQAEKFDEKIFEKRLREIIK